MNWLILFVFFLKEAMGTLFLLPWWTPIFVILAEANHFLCWASWSSKSLWRKFFIPSEIGAISMEDTPRSAEKKRRKRWERIYKKKLLNCNTLTSCFVSHLLDLLNLLEEGSPLLASHPHVYPLVYMGIRCCGLRRPSSWLRWWTCPPHFDVSGCKRKRWVKRKKKNWNEKQERAYFFFQGTLRRRTNSLRRDHQLHSSVVQKECLFSNFWPLQCPKVASFLDSSSLKHQEAWLTSRRASMASWRMQEALAFSMTSVDNGAQLASSCNPSSSSSSSLAEEAEEA